MCVRCSEPLTVTAPRVCSPSMLLSARGAPTSRYANIWRPCYLASTIAPSSAKLKLTPMVWTTQASCHIVTARRLSVYFVTATLTE